MSESAPDIDGRVAKDSRRKHGDSDPASLPFDLKLTYFANECSEISNSPNFMNLKKNFFNGELQLGQLDAFSDDLRLKDVSNMIVVVAGKC